jgi:hypothetical protein
MSEPKHERLDPFNSPIEIGLRALAILSEAFPASYSLQRLVILDYLSVHSDDIPDGPEGLHPKTPHRSEELLVRRKVLEKGLLLYQSRGLIERQFTEYGVYYAGTERSAAFLDALSAEYTLRLRERAGWLAARFGEMPDHELDKLVKQHLGIWGAEFVMESVLWEEGAQ